MNTAGSQPSGPDCARGWRTCLLMTFPTNRSYEITVLALRPFSKRPRGSACRFPWWIAAMFQPVHPILTSPFKAV